MSDEIIRVRILNDHEKTAITVIKSIFDTLGIEYNTYTSTCM